MVVVSQTLRGTLPSASEAIKFLKEAKGQHLAVDTETSGLLIRDGRDYTQGLSIAYKDQALGVYFSWYFPFRHKFGENYDRDVLDLCRQVIETAPSLTFHNAKFDIVALAQLGIKVRTGCWIDTAVMAHLINENFPFSKKLDDLAKAYLPEGVNKQMSEEMAAIVNGKPMLLLLGPMGASSNWALVPSEMMFDYARIDTEVTLMLREVLWEKFTAEGLEKFWPHKARLIEVVMEMERRGVRINKERTHSLLDAAEQAVQDYSDMLGGSPGKREFLVRTLLEELCLPVVKRSPKTGEPSFDKEAMNVYDQILSKRDSPLAQQILAYRGWVHAKGLFYGPYLSLISPDGRIRPSYKHHKDAEEGGTVTGRLSCSDPNLQQIPRVSSKEWNGKVKQCFVGSEGFSLWEADYSQLELRLGTAYAREEELLAIFEEDRDVFTEMAASLGWPRQETKGFVYSTQYGAGRTRISHVFGVSEEDAQERIDAYYRRFPKFRAVSEAAKQRCLTDRKVRLWSGRYRHFRNPREENHKAFNSLIQGGAADIVERIMVHVYDTVDALSNGEVRMLLQVHDSIVFEIKDGREEFWGPKIVKAMSDVNEVCTNFGVKFAVDFHRFGG